MDEKTKELIARLRNWSNYGGIGVDDWIRPNGVRADVIAAAAALAAQAQEIERLKRLHAEAFSLMHQERAEATEARVRDVETECEQLRERIINRDVQIAIIEAKTFTETREQCAQVADRLDSVNGIGANIRALHHVGRDTETTTSIET